MRAMMGEEGRMPDPGVSCIGRRPVAGMEEFGRLAGVAWMRSAVWERLPSLLPNWGRSVDAGTTEALDGGMSKVGRGWDWEVSAASASLNRLLAGVAFTWTSEARLGFFISARETVSLGSW